MKTCDECGRRFLYPEGISRAQWEARRFCAMTCYRAYRRGRPNIIRNPPERRVEPENGWWARGMAIMASLQEQRPSGRTA